MSSEKETKRDIDIDVVRESYASKRGSRRSCIFKLVLVWVSIGLGISLVMMIVRGSAVTEPEEIEAVVSDYLLEKSFPADFEPYRVNHFMGVTVMAYWDMSRVREDGRSFSVISMVTKSEWQDEDPQTLFPELIEALPEQLDRNEFHAEDQQVLSREIDGETVEVHVYRGKSRLDAGLKDAVSCFRFLKTAAGPLQVQSLGLTETFPEDQQVEALFSLKPRRFPHQ